jgi:hypothetical protein
MFVLCRLHSKDRRQKPGEDTETSTDQVQRENKRITNPAV